MLKAIQPSFTIIIPPVHHDFRTKWHPVLSTSPSLTRGAFKTTSEAIQWARDHLNGTPYQLVELDLDALIDYLRED